MADLFFDQSTFFSKSVFFNTQSCDSTELPTHRYGYHWDRLEANPHTITNLPHSTGTVIGVPVINPDSFSSQPLRIMDGMPIRSKDYWADHQPV